MDFIIANGMIPLIFIVVFSVSAIFIVLTRIQLRKQSKALDDKIKKISSTNEHFNSEANREILSKFNTKIFIDIPTDLNNNFNGEFIASTTKKEVIESYTHLFHQASSLQRKLNTFRVKIPDTISKFIHDYNNIHDIVKHHNTEVVQTWLEKYKYFFDNCLKYPLDEQQRRSIVSEEDNCLVVSSAGSGKTSSIVGKVKYLTEIKGIAPERILLISYTNKAAAELTERMATAGLNGYTFHKLAIDIIRRETGIKPSICENTDALFIKIFRDLSKNKEFKKSILSYFSDYQIEESEWMCRKNERREYLAEQKNTQIKAVFPDMDGKNILVRSKQEQKICFILSSLGVKFRYEEPYEYEVADEMHAQYKPDFSIYFEQNGEMRRIYLEHFGINEKGFVPAWFAKDKNISYEEANQKYNDGITWKKAVHEKFGTELLITSSADFQYQDIKEKIKSLLLNAEVPIQEIPEAELYNLILPKESKREKAFIRLMATFSALIKTSCKSIDDILREVRYANDERSEFVIKNIFVPVYEQYIEELGQSGQIDFTDAILQATEICKMKQSTEYDYIIVDEFQDISVDRYNFLKVLRKGSPVAKLYCVGDDWQSIYRFSGSDMALFNQFSEYFGPTDITKIETTYRFGEPLVSLSSTFIQRNRTQIQKNIHSFSHSAKTELEFHSYERREYCNTIREIVDSIPVDKSIFLLGRFSFDDYYLSFMYQSIKEGNKFFYWIGGRKIEFLTVHKSKGLEADYVILLQCNKDTYGFPSLVSDDPVLHYILTQSDKFPFGEERRLFYVAITRAKEKTFVLYDKRFPSIFVDEFLSPQKISGESYTRHPNANKKWTKRADQFLLQLHKEGKSIKYIANKMGRSQTSIAMRLNKLYS